MKRTEALKSILIEWAINYKTSESFSIFQWEQWEYAHLVEPAIVCWFSGYPTNDRLEVFNETYAYWMLALYNNINKLLTGETTFEKVIFERVTEETWL